MLTIDGVDYNNANEAHEAPATHKADATNHHGCSENPRCNVKKEGPLPAIISSHIMNHDTPASMKNHLVCFTKSCA